MARLVRCGNDFPDTVGARDAGLQLFLAIDGELVEFDDLAWEFASAGGTPAFTDDVHLVQCFPAVDKLKVLFIDRWRRVGGSAIAVLIRIIIFQIAGADPWFALLHL